MWHWLQYKPPRAEQGGGARSWRSDTGVPLGNAKIVHEDVYTRPYRGYIEHKKTTAYCNVPIRFAELGTGRVTGHYDGKETVIAYMGAFRRTFSLCLVSVGLNFLTFSQ